MKILLIQPPTSELAIGCDSLFIQEPLALEYTGAIVAGRHEVKLLDLRLEDTFEEVLKQYAPELVGFTAYTIHVNTVKQLCSGVKAFNPGIFTVVGGIHATMCPNDFDHPAVDAVLIGEGVFTFREIVDALEKGAGLSGIWGSGYRENERLKLNPSRRYPELDSFPFPDRGLTSKYRHLYYSEWLKPIASLRTSRGCPFRCKFCCLWKLAQGQYLTREPETIVEELKTIEEPFVFIADDESFIDIKRMDRLADLIRKEGIQKNYFSYVRSDTVIRHTELIEKWKEIGLIRVLIGMESHREEDLKEYNKRNSTETNAKAAAILKALGITINASFIIKQEFDEKDFDELANYVKAMELDTPSFPVLTPFPGTELYEEVKDKIICHNYDLYDSVHTLLPTKLSLSRFYGEVSYLYLKCGRSNKAAKAMEPDLLQRLSKSYGKLKRAHLHHAQGPG